MKILKIADFAKQECANSNKGKCILLAEEPCLISEGKTCRYFQKCVLCKSGYKFGLPEIDYQSLNAQYLELQKKQDKLQSTIGI